VSPQPQNLRAQAAYRYAIFGIIPLAGLLLGPVAVVLGLLGWRDARGDLKTKGGGFAVAAVILGLLELLTNGLGLTLMWVGWESMGR
jgi:hypothetical protein